MAYFRCTTGGSGKGNTLVVTCADDLAGATITCTDGTKTYRKTCPSTAPYEVTFYGLEAGTWTISATVSGNTYTATAVITDYEAELGGFSWRRWVDTASQLDSSDYNNLDEVLSDEEAVRELCLEHNCVDYLARVASATADVETIINNNLFAKWVNNSDYALDFLGANVVIKALMDEADKYGYGEWALVGQVPKMTSNTAPYGKASASSSYSSAYDAWKAFDKDDSTAWNSAENYNTNQWISYDFQKDVIVKSFMITQTADYAAKNAKLQASSDNFVNDVHDIETFVFENDANAHIYNIENDTAYRYYRLFLIDNYARTSFNIKSLQFYGWAPKGNVPVMTANNAPYGNVLVSSALYSGSVGYSAFDGNDSSMTISAVNASTFYLGYKFVNPIKVARLRLYVGDGSVTQYGQYAYSFNVQASNDGSNWSLLKSVSGTDGSEIIVDIPSEKQDYYLYYRLAEIKHKNNVANVSMYFNYIGTLQFYGRELKVSVPTMTSNNAPYGECIYSTQTSGAEAWHAFTTNDSTSHWLPTDGAINNRIGYKFAQPTVARKVHFTTYASANDHGSANMLIQGYDGTNWVTLGTFTFAQATANKDYDIDFDNDIPYEAYCLFTEDMLLHTTPTYVVKAIDALQFYGLDYSEKEFEESTTKKWLYDHGVELENVQEYPNGGTITKNADQIELIGPGRNDATGVFCSADFTQFNHAFARCGNVYLNTTYEAFSIGSTIGGTPQASARPIPLPLAYLDVSSINATYNVYYSTASNGKCSLKELWLE